MTVLSLQEAVERTGTSKVDIWRAIQAGTLSAKKTDDGGFAIDPENLFAVFETRQADQRPIAEEAVAPVEASPTEASTSDELRQNRDERPAVELAERNAQLTEPTAQRPKNEKRADHAALADELPWWRRLVRWIRARRGTAARKRLRERLHG